MRLVALAAALGLLALASGQAAAQTQTVSPFGVRSTNVSGTITTGGTFQSVFLAIPAGTTQRRYGCTIQNTSTHTQWVFFGPLASATEAKAYQIAPGQPISCQLNDGTVLQDQVSITGTTSDTFVAAGQ